MKIFLGFLALSLGLSPVLAEDQSDQNAFVKEFASVVAAGQGIPVSSFDPDVSVAEAEAIGQLKGCEPSVGNGSRVGYVVLDWTCEGSPDLERSTTIKFSGKRAPQLFLNPLPRNFAPTDASLNAEKLPDRRALAWRFASAVKKGDDPSLGGLIPITPEQLDVLGTLEGLDFLKGSGKAKESAAMFWDLKQDVLRNPIVTTVKFNAEGRPIGLLISGATRVRRRA